jgi:uncharacterized protein (DUF1501 family)
MVVPVEQYAAYSGARGPLALPRSSLLRVSGAVSQAVYGFHPAMSEIADLFNSRALAVVANVGRLPGPAASLAEARSMFKKLTPVDTSLKYLPGGYAVPGWAADGETLTGFPDGRGTSLLMPGKGHGGGSPDGGMFSRSLRSPFPGTGIGQQLKQVAGILASGTNADAGGQVFLVQLGGFATSSNQLERHAALLRQLSEAMHAFYGATVDMGIANRVVTYTDTEYNRTLAPNKKGGSETGWGGHQLVMGGGVVGGDVYGEFPAMELAGASDVTGAGVWLPAISKRQFSQNFATWMGMPDTGAAGPRLNFLA